MKKKKIIILGASILIVGILVIGIILELYAIRLFRKTGRFDIIQVFSLKFPIFKVMLREDDIGDCFSTGGGNTWQDPADWYKKCLKSEDCYKKCLK